MYRVRREVQVPPDCARVSCAACGWGVDQRARRAAARLSAWRSWCSAPPRPAPSSRSATRVRRPRRQPGRHARRGPPDVTLLPPAGHGTAAHRRTRRHHAPDVPDHTADGPVGHHPRDPTAGAPVPAAGDGRLRHRRRPFVPLPGVPRLRGPLPRRAAAAGRARDRPREGPGRAAWCCCWPAAQGASGGTPTVRAAGKPSPSCETVASTSSSCGGSTPGCRRPRARRSAARDGVPAGDGDPVGLPAARRRASVRDQPGRVRLLRVRPQRRRHADYAMSWYGVYDMIRAAVFTSGPPHVPSPRAACATGATKTTGTRSPTPRRSTAATAT